jgi:iron(III) transport system ATP-binding protein
MTVPRLEIRDIAKSFGGRAVVGGVSLSVMPGQVTCLLGPSGCGKSTTLRIIAGVDMQDSGTIHVDGALMCDTVTRVPPEGRSIGLMFQDFALFPHLSVADNVGFCVCAAGAKENANRITELLEKVGMTRHLKAYSARAVGRRTTADRLGARACAQAQGHVDG